MLNSADGVSFPTSCPPPMMISCGTHSANFGSSATAAAMLLSGPIGMRVIGCVAARYVSISHSTAFAEAAGRSLRSIGNQVPCGSSAESAVKRRCDGNAERTIGRASPACTGISPLPTRSSVEMLLIVVASSGALPKTVVTPIRSRAGCSAASISATASSVPVSQSMISWRRSLIAGAYALTVRGSHASQSDGTWAIRDWGSPFPRGFCSAAAAP